MTQKINRGKRKIHTQNITALPNQETVTKLCDLLYSQYKRQERTRKYAPVKEVLALLGRGALISAAILAPKSVSNIAPILRQSPDWNDWRHYNISYLRRTLQHLENLKQVEVATEGDVKVIKLNQEGRRKILKYSFDTLAIEKPKQWDGKWRLVLYDVPKDSNNTRDIIRQALRNLNFYPIQESVYLSPYPCYNQIEFIRQYYAIGSAVQYMLVEKIENDGLYRVYFGL